MQPTSPVANADFNNSNRILSKMEGDQSHVNDLRGNHNRKHISGNVGRLGDVLSIDNAYKYTPCKHSLALLVFSDLDIV